MERQTVNGPHSAAQMIEPDDEREPLPSDSARRTGTAAALIAAVRVFGDRLFSLVTLEGKQAGISLAFMLGFGVAAAVLVITGWLALIACVVVALVENDVMGWPWALVIASLLSFAGAAGLVFLLIQRSEDLLFAATRRQLRFERTTETEHEMSKK